MKVLRNILIRALISAAVIPAVPAMAQTTAYAPGQGSPNQITLSIPVRASVGGRCGFTAPGTPSGTFNKPNFDVAGLLHEFPFTLDCTGPSRVAVVSTNGGLLIAGAAPSGYTNLAPYDVTLNLVGSAGSMAAGSCQVATLKSGATCSFVGPASTSQGLRLNSPSVGQTGTYLRVSAPPYTGTNTLIAGTYADTLTVTVSAAP